MRIVTVSLLVLSISLTACFNRTNNSPRPSISDEERASLEKPINCATAKKDIATLEDEKASVGRQIVAGVRSVVPFAAASGALLGDYQDRTEVATGEYNDALERKIQQIKSVCGV
jgi:hypothetical protein